MTTTPAAPAPQAGGARTLHLSELLRRPLTDRGGESLGRLSDVIVRLRGAEYPLVTGLVATVGGREVYVPIEQVGDLGGLQPPDASERAAQQRTARMADERLELAPFAERMPGRRAGGRAAEDGEPACPPTGVHSAEHPVAAALL